FAFGRRLLVYVSLALTFAACTSGVTEGPGVRAGATFRCLGRPATIVGGPAQSFIRGTAGPDVIVTLDAHGALIHADEGNDVVCGGPGDDTVFGGRGADLIAGRGGDDHLIGEGARDTLLGGPGDDVLRGAGGRDGIGGGP